MEQTHTAYSSIEGWNKLANFLLALTLCTAPSWAQSTDDKDRDRIPDAIDNCTAVSNPDQRDTDGDGIGNICDGDLNNDGVVNSLDSTIFSRRLLTKDPDADLDGNGIVNSIDLTLFKAMLSKPPGPSAVAIPLTTPALDFGKNPPPALRSEMFAISSGQTGPGRRDGVMVMEFAPEVRKRFAIRETIIVKPSDSGDVLNDLGIEPDIRRGDNVFSGFVKLTETPAKALADLQKFKASLANARNPRSGIFKGRQLLEVARPRDFEIRFPISPLPGLTPFPTPIFPSSPPFTGDENRALAITHLSVIADPKRTFDLCDTDGDGQLGAVDGPWSFKTLMTNMANESMTTVSPKVFVHTWLRRWLVSAPVNTFMVPARAAGMNSEILNSLTGWNEKDASTLDLNTLPFRLLAILYRPDLGTAGYGRPAGDPTEIRFVFGLLKKSSGQCTPNQAGMTVIFEYADRTLCQGIKERAQQWLALDTSNPAFPSPAYNTALQAITDQVTTANAKPLNANGSSLNQLRTNEIALALGAGWELREFKIDFATHQLEPSPLAQTPQASFNMTTRLAACINDLNCRQDIPLTHSAPGFPPTPFRAGSQIYGQTFRFDAPTGTVALNEDRRAVSQNTCGGCHGANALNPSVTLGAGGLGVVPPFPAFLSGSPESFYHVDPRTPGGTPARLSRFMKGTQLPVLPGTPIPDAVQIGGSVQLPATHFNDLLRRGNIMQAQAVTFCGFAPASPFLREQFSLPFVH